ncbi:MAG: hypothetical protein L6R42_006120 [Xanthoria sp. 1 TBL-2021]|nr:MAG: hypothetical protein L6R42_006120 [Xanthoria sp. 1 TBL-2021]
MPPKKDNAPAGEPKLEESNDKEASAVPSKRKAKSNDAPAKAPRRSGRGAPQAQPDPVTSINHLLSPESLDSCRPKDEIEDVKNRGSGLRTYSSSTFSPFEELMCAVILSRPISHALAVNEARTQHRQKTAEELVILADAVVDHLGDGDEDVNLERVQRECDHDWEKEKEMLKKYVKKLGKTGLDIFGRRIQAQWPALYPFADQRTLSGLQKLGLPGTAEELKKLMDHHWTELNLQGFEGNEDEKKRRVFVQVLERAIGVDLQGNADGVRAEATIGTKND